MLFRSGRYIDVGAWDPRVDSVSRGFYEKGWRGVHFEPHPVHAARLRADRPDEVVHEIALSDHQGELRFHLVGDDGTSTGNAELARAAAGAHGSVREIVVPMTTLAHACGDLAGKDVHWLKIDVEGMEEQVLRGWDAAVLRPWIVVVEATRPLTRIETHHAFAPILESADYVPAAFDGLNRYYVAREHGDLAAALADPVSVLDLSEGCELSDTSAFVAHKIERLAAHIQCLESSWSWRLTRPLRWLHDIVRRRP